MRRSFYKFKHGKRLQDSYQQRNYVVRIFHPRGIYPRIKLLQPNAIFWADDEIVFSVTHSIPWRAHDKDAPFTEMDWLDPDEIQFLGSILFSERRNDTHIRFYPIYGFGPKIDKKTLDLTNSKVAEEIRNSILIELHRPTPSFQGERLYECRTLRYSLIDPEIFNLDRQPIYWAGISTNDYLMLRGISALLKSDMLSSYYEFYEEATISAFISMEASFRLIVRKLEKMGITNPSAREAAQWVFENFDEPMGLARPAIDRYFEEFYDQRVMTLHPASRFGDNPYAPLMHDDYHHLRSSIREILAYLAAGTHGPDYYEDVRRWGTTKNS